MQFNIYVPKEKERIVEIIYKISAMTGKPKNELVIEALEKFIAMPIIEKPELGRFDIGTKQIDRKDIYEDMHL